MAFAGLLWQTWPRRRRSWATFLLPPRPTARWLAWARRLAISSAWSAPGPVWPGCCTSRWNRARHWPSATRRWNGPWGRAANLSLWRANPTLCWARSPMNAMNWHPPASNLLRGWSFPARLARLQAPCRLPLRWPGSRSWLEKTKPPWRRRVEHARQHHSSICRWSMHM